jgi:hypothetical protein
VIPQFCLLATTVCFCIDAIAIVFWLWIGFGLIVLSGWVMLRQIHSFLAKNAPVAADVLVVEGWLPDYALQSAAIEFKQGAYQQLITVGSKIPRGVYLSEYDNFAALAAATLIAIGVDPQRISIVTDTSSTPGRTANAAALLDRWLTTSELQIAALNLFTLGTHARRSWLLFDRLLAPKLLVGIIAVEPLNYNTQSWWHSSEGVRTVISELLAYLSVRIGKLP